MTIDLAGIWCCCRMACTGATQDARYCRGALCIGASAEQLPYCSDETVPLSLHQPASICCIQFSIQPLILQQLSSRHRRNLLLLELPWGCCAVRLGCVVTTLGPLSQTAARFSTLCFVQRCLSTHSVATAGKGCCSCDGCWLDDWGRACMHA